MTGRWRIKHTLLGLMLVSLAPFLLLGVTWSMWARQDEKARVRGTLVDLARIVAFETDRVVNESETLLAALAEAPPVKRLDPAGTDAFFSRLLPRYPHYENITALDANGRMYGTALDPARKVWPGDRAWFQASMRSEGLTVGDPLIGRVKGRPVVIMAYPVRDDAGRRVATVAVAVGLLLVQKALAEVPISEGAIITLLNADGKVLARTAEPEAWVLKDLSGTGIFKAAVAAESGFFEGTGLDGVARVMAFVRAKGVPWIVMVSVPSAHAWSRFWRAFAGHGLSLLGASLLALVLAWLFGRRLVATFNRLLERAHEVAGGRLERGGPPEGAEREVVQVFDAFDRMVDALETSRAEREERYRELAALHAVAAAINEPFNLSQILTTTLDRAVEVMEADAGMIYLLNEPASVLEVAAHRGFSPAYVQGVDRVALGEGGVGRVAGKGEPEVIEDVRTDPRVARAVVRTEGIVSVLMVPAASKRKILGTLYVATRSPRSFTSHEIQILASISHQIGAAVENARLFEATQERLRETELLLDVAGALGSTLEMTPLLKRIARKTAQACRVDRCTIELWDAAGRVIPAMSQFADGRVDRELWEKFRAAKPYPAGEVPAHALIIQRREPVVIQDTSATDLIPREWVETFGLKSFLVVPLISREQVIGTLCLDHQAEAKGFTREQVSLATTIASQVALAVENVRLLAAERSQAGKVAALREIALEMTGALELEPLLQLIVRQAVELVRAHSGTIYLAGETGQRLVPHAWHNLGEWVRDRVHRLGEGVTGLAALERRGLIVNDYPRSSHRVELLLNHVPITAVISAPLIIRDRLVGVVTLNAVEAGRTFHEEDLSLLSMLAAQAAVAIEAARLHREIRDARDFLQSVIEDSADAIITTDSHGRFTSWSPAAREIFGYRAEEILGRPIADYYRGGLDEAKAVMRRLGAEEKIPNYETAFRAKDGRWVEVNTSISLLRDASGAVVGTLGVVKDITEQKRLKEELIRSERLRVLGEMAAGVAHDFNNLLGIILSQSELLERRLTGPADAAEHLRAIQRAVADGVQTVRRIQEFAGLRRDQPFVTLDINAIVREVVALTEPRWLNEANAAGIPIKVEVETQEVGPVAGNPAEVREVLVNLILNALDAMPGGGRLTLRTRPASHPDGRDGGGVEIEVRDTGIGMSEEVRPRVFEPFFTTKAGRGVGLGLSVSQGIVQRHGGEIRVETREGEGSVFTVRLPVGVGVGESPEPPTPASGAPLRVLVIDDEETLRKALVDLFKAGGHAVEAAEDGASGLERFRPGAFDLVVTDLGMPGMSGWEVARSIKNTDPAVGVIMLTGWGDQLPPDLVQSSQVDRVVVKPVSIGALMSVVSALGRQRTPSQ